MGDFIYFRILRYLATDFLVYFIVAIECTGSHIFYFDFIIFQIVYAIRNVQKALHGESKVSTHDFKQFLKRHSVIPAENEDKPFVLGYDTKRTRKEPNVQKYEEDTFDFVCVLTTKRLLRNALNAKILHADSTYKTNWMGMPLHVFGVTDNHRVFHLIAMAFSTKEDRPHFEFCFKTIKEGILKLFDEEIRFPAFMSDACQALKNAYRAQFPDSLELVCYFHVKKAVKQRKFEKQTNRDLFMADLTQIHLCASLEIFEIATSLFLKKWQKEEKDVVDYFKKQWLSNSNKHWFAGAMPLTPSTNNGLESTNLRLKNDCDLRARAKINVFKNKILSALKMFSCEYKDEIKWMRWDVPITNQMWTEGLDWARSEKKIEVQPNNDSTIYYVPAAEVNVVSKKTLKTYNEKIWRDFSSFVDDWNSIWRVEMPNENLDGSTCTCPPYLKLYMCKHIVGIRLRLQTLDIPDHIEKVEKRRNQRGRPSRVPPALVRDR